MRPDFVTPQSEGTSTAPRDPAYAGGLDPARVGDLDRAHVGGRTAEADRTALEIRAALDRLSAVLARAAAGLVRLRAWHVFGFARLDDHARERLGRSGRWLRDLAALGEGLAASRPLASALTGDDGGRPLGRVAAILVARAIIAPPRAIIAPPTTRTDEEWIAAARLLSVRELRTAIRTERAAAATGRTERAATATGPADATGPPGQVAGSADATGPPGEVPGGPGAPDAAPGAADKALGATDESPEAADDDDLDADRCFVRLPVPLPVVVAFEEALDLHRAIEGRSTSVTAFVEALVGEAQSGGSDISAGYVAPLVRGVPEGGIEAALRRATDGWASLPEPFAPEPVPFAEASAGLERFAALEAVAGRGDAVELDRQIRSLIRLENELEARLGQVLAAMAEHREWQRLRFAGLGHYAEERLGMSRSRAGERARLARALRPLPAVGAACASGRISMEAAALIHRMLGDEPVGPDVEAAWVEHASAVTLKRMRDEARAAGRYRARAWPSGSPANSADCPSGSPANRDESRRPTGIMGSGVTTADSRSPLPLEEESRDALEDESRLPLADERWFASLRRAPGTAVRRIFEFGFRAAGLSNPCTPAPEVFHSDANAAAPDVLPSNATVPDVFLRLRLPADLAADFLAAIEAARDAAETRAASAPWDSPWPGGAAEPSAPEALAVLAERPSAWVARIAFVRGRRAPLWVGLLALLEDFALTWDTDAGAPDRRDDTVFVRDGWRCAAPGCSSRRNLEAHHVVYRSRGGSDDGWNLVTLCRFHHQRGEHGGLLSVRGRAPTGLTWRLGRSDVATCFRADKRHSA